MLTIKKVLDRFAEHDLESGSVRLRTRLGLCPLQVVTRHKFAYRLIAWDMGLKSRETAAIIGLADHRQWPIRLYGRNPMEE